MSNPGIISTHAAYSNLVSSVYGANEVSTIKNRPENTEAKPVETNTGKDIEDEAIISKEALTMLETRKEEDDQAAQQQGGEKEKSTVLAEKKTEEDKKPESEKEDNAKKK